MNNNLLLQNEQISDLLPKTYCLAPNLQGKGVGKVKVGDGKEAGTKD